MGFLSSSLRVDLARAIPVDALLPGGRGGFSIFGGRTRRRGITDEELLKTDEKGPPTARLALDALAFAESTAEWAVWGPPPGRSRRRSIAAKAAVLAASRSGRAALLRQMSEDGDLEIIPEHPWTAMVRQGTMGLTENPGMWIPGDETLRLQRRYLQTLGESVFILERKPVQVGGRRVEIPVRWAPVPPTWITPPTGDRAMFVLRRGGAEENIAAEDVVWYRAAAMADPYGRGVGPMQSLAEDLQLDEAQMKYLNALMANGGEPRSLAVAAGFGPHQQEILNQKLVGRGPDRVQAVAVLDPPSAEAAAAFKIHKLGESPTDLGIESHRGATRDRILQANRVAPAAIGVTEDANRAVAQQARRDFREVVNSNLEALRGFWQTRFFDPLGDRPAEYAGEDRLVLQFSLPPLADPETAAQLMGIAPEMFTEEDFRQAAGLTGGNPERRIVRNRVHVSTGV